MVQENGSRGSIFFFRPSPAQISYHFLAPRLPLLTPTTPPQFSTLFSRPLTPFPPPLTKFLLPDVPSVLGRYFGGMPGRRFPRPREKSDKKREKKYEERKNQERKKMRKKKKKNKNKNKKNRGKKKGKKLRVAIKKTVKGFPRPLLDLSVKSFAAVIDEVFGKKLNPPFNPYANELNYLIASYLVPYVGLTGYVGANPKLQNAVSKRLVAGLLAVESGQDAVLRGLLYERKLEKVFPYGLTVAEFTHKISVLRNTLGKAGVKDEGLRVQANLGAENETRGNVLAGAMS